MSERQQRQQLPEPNGTLTQGQVNAVLATFKAESRLPHRETIRDLPVRRAKSTGVRISKIWKTQIATNLGVRSSFVIGLSVGLFLGSGVESLRARQQCYW